jgi:large subunit ribosomal protein L1
MSRKTGQKYTAALQQVELKPYSVEEAVPLVKKVKFAKFDETVELHLRLGVDGKHADQMVRGTIVLPNGLGKSKKVLVIASGDKQREATEAGADYVGGDDMVNKIQTENWTDFDAVIATPDMMRGVGRLGKVLGPRGLMPNPKTGKVSFEANALVENTNMLLQAVVKAKPAAAKGKYVRSATICSTMGPGVHLDVTPYNLKAV